ncbi:hypothetical protein NA57DRAFT_54336 [Rhizodiscina lignyota]|uniref:F-box domain-containing protein n=1 Tax=Rhizodiscina lignyota TaxID=1504668 RepID=A0A9P4M7Q0_9PEZI|nr:hypothetical protein NA57DRAFT_54336 [Rhizodiscina lignyota]
MSSFRLNDLPTDIHLVICSYLWAVSPRTIRALYRVNRNFHEIAISFLYRGLSLSISSPEGLRNDVTALEENAVCQRYLQHARQLELTGRMLAVGDNDSWQRVVHQPFHSVDDSFSTAESLNPSFESVFVMDGKSDNREDALEAWNPLIYLLPKFQRLSDLIYNCDSKFPPQLLDTVSQHHPECKVHLRSFRFKSLNEPVTDPDELALAQSPLLHSLSIKCTYRDSRGVDDFNGDAAIRTVALAPNLKHVRILGCRPASSPQLQRARNIPRGEWKGFIPPVDIFKKAHLLSLSFCAYDDRLSRKKLDLWEKHIHFNSLQRMQFSVSDSTILRDMMINNQLASLEELCITLECQKTDETFKDVAESFFVALNPLKVLKVGGTLHRELVMKICEQHGGALHELSFTPYEDGYGMAGPPLRFNEDDFGAIANTCHILREIKITIRRSMGNRQETECYEALGKIRTLREVNLQLDCTNAQNPGQPLAEWDEFNRMRSDTGMRLANGHLECAIINSAVDETLVRSIWDIISENNPKLQSLRVTPHGGSGFGNSHPGDLMTIVHNLSRTFFLSRSETDENKLDVFELTIETRENYDRSQREHEKIMLEKWGNRGLNGASWKVFQHLWPFSEETEDWREVWSSRPLQREDHAQ